MDKIKLRQKTIQRTKFVINNPAYKQEFKFLIKAINSSEKKIIEKAIDYDMCAVEQKYNNKIYSTKEMNLTLHLLNLVKNSYHQIRQDAVIKFLNKINPESIAEIGFGTPSKYVFEYVLQDNKKLTLIDMDSSTINFAKIILNYKVPSWEKQINFKIDNMDNQKYPGNFDTYLFMDSIEHTKDPTLYLSQLVKKSPDKSNFILSIPICKIDSFSKKFHYYEWKTEKAAEEWLNKCGLQIDEKIIARPNKKVDFFINFIKGGMYNIIVRCSKRYETQYDKKYQDYLHKGKRFEINNAEHINLLKKELGNIENKKILDIGCGIGDDLNYCYLRGAEVIGIDSSKNMIQEGINKYPHLKKYMQIANFNNLPFQNNSFDIIISNCAIHYAKNPTTAFKEIYRVLKKNGTAGIIVAHPLMLLSYKKENNYHTQEIVNLPIFDGQLIVQEPSHTFSNYLSPFLLKNFNIIAFHEGRKIFINIKINEKQMKIPTFIYFKIQKK